MLGCIISVESIASGAIGAIITAVFALWRYYKERKHTLKMQTYIEYLTAFQEMIVHMNDKASFPRYQNAYFVTCSKVYLCAPFSILELIRELHAGDKRDINHYRCIINSMRADLEMGEVPDFPFEIWTNMNQVKDTAKVEVTLQTQCPFLSVCQPQQKCERRQ